MTARKVIAVAAATSPFWLALVVAYLKAGVPGLMEMAVVMLIALLGAVVAVWGIRELAQ